MSYLNETRYRWFSLDSEADLSTVDLDLSVDQVTWTTAEHTTEPLLVDLPAPDPGFTRYWWRALFGPAEPLTLTEPEQTIYGRATVGLEELRPTWVVRSEEPVETFPCDWPIDYCADSLPKPLDGMEAPRVQLYERMAVDFLWNWTERRFGTCQTAVRPCRVLCPPGSRSPYTPHLIGGRWYNIACGDCGDTCGCTYTPTVVLPDIASSVDQVLIDGAVMSPTRYRLDNGRYLRRTDGGRWPVCQNLTVDTTEPGSWEITYTAGIPVPVGGQVAAGVLAKELAKAACGDSTCELPQRIQSITRQGLAVVLDTFDDIEKGHTGIWLVDSWVASVTKAPVRSKVYSPDISRRAPRRPVR